MLRLGLVALICVLALWGYESKTGTAGYLRVQTSFEEEKANLCFKAPGAATKYRLGNECETWLELGVYQDITLENGMTLHTQVRPSFMGANNESVKLLRWDELYTELSNFSDNTAAVWVGRRFYKRYDSFISDFFFFNMSGTGAGVSNIGLGEGLKLSYAFMFENLDPASISDDERVLMQSHDIRLAKDTGRGELTLFANYMRIEEKTFKSTQKLKGVDGFAAGLLYQDNEIFQELFGMKGNNIAGLFIGEGAAKGAGMNSSYLQEGLIDAMLASNGDLGDAKTLRLINYNSFENDRFGIMSNFVYEYRDEGSFSNTKQNWTSIGVRSYWFMHDHARALLEGGYDYVNESTSHKIYRLAKISAALEFALKRGLSERPVLRLFYTQAFWNDDAKGLVGTADYQNKTQGDNIGLQLEYWW